MRVCIGMRVLAVGARDGGLAFALEAHEDAGDLGGLGEGEVDFSGDELAGSVEGVGGVLGGSAWLGGGSVEGYGEVGGHCGV